MSSPSDLPSSLVGPSSTATTTDTETGGLHTVNLEGSIYSCNQCQTHLGLDDDVISKAFLCQDGKAYLFSKVVNVTVGEKEDRMLLTGLHTVGDIFCVGCGSIIGWKYLVTREQTQKYKEGKFLLSRVKLSGPDDGHSDGVNRDPQVTGSDAVDA